MHEDDEYTDTQLWDQTNHPDPETKLEALNELIDRFYFRSQFSEAISAALAGVAIAEKIGDKVAEAKISHTLGLSYGFLDRNAEAEPCFKHAAELHHLHSTEYETAQSLHFLGLAQRELKEYPEAEDSLRSAIALYKSSGWSVQAGEVAIACGEMLRKLNRQKDALALFEDSIEYFEERSTPVNLARSRERISVTLYELGRLEESLVHFKNARDVFKYLENSFMFAGTSMNYAEALLKADRLNDALSAIDEAIEYFRDQVKNFELAARADSIKCQILYKLGRHAEADSNHSMISSVLTNPKNKTAILDHNIDYASVIKDETRAIKMLTDAMQLAGSEGLPESYAKACLALAEVLLKAYNENLRAAAPCYLADIDLGMWGDREDLRIRQLNLISQFLAAE